MDGIINVLVFCALFGTIFLGIGLAVSGILRWLRPTSGNPDPGTAPVIDIEKRRKRLNIASWVAFVVLCLMLLAYFGVAGLPGSENNYGTIESMGSPVENEAGEVLGTAEPQQSGGDTMTVVALNILRMIIGLLMFGSIAFSVIMLLFAIIFFICKVLSIIIQAKKGNGHANEESKKFVDIIKVPVVRGFVAWGIFALFFVLPFVVGERTNGSPMETWKSGVNNIVDLFYMGSKTETPSADSEAEELYTDSEEGKLLTESKEGELSAESKAEVSSTDILISYMLIYIIVLGVGSVVIKLLCSIIEHASNEEEKGELIDEYSSSIALLAVGVAALWAMKGKAEEEDYGKLIFNLLKAFGTVMFIAALVILTLEIIRLLMDMKEKIIRQEARYLFISLIGKSAMLLLGALNWIYDAVNSVMGNIESRTMHRMDDRVKKRMVDIMGEQMDDRDKPKGKVTFSVFDERTTKK